MMKKSLLMLSAAFLMLACTENNDNNKSLDYDKLDVNFSVKTSGVELPEGAIFGVYATCGRGSEADFSMGGAKDVLEYRTVKAGSSSELVACSEEDKIQSLKGDHNFRFYAVYPYTENFDPAAIPFSVPEVQSYEKEPTDYCRQASHIRTTTVIPTLEFKTKNPVALLNFTFPLDIISAGEAARLKSVTLKANDELALGSDLAGSGIINLDGDYVEFDQAGGSKTITYTFIEGGLQLTGPTTVTLAVLPFTVPEGGMVLTLEDENGKKRDCKFWNTSAEEGQVLKGGSVSDITITASGIIPIKFPVIFPLGTSDGTKDGEHFFNATTQPDWVSKQYISCTEQPAAYAKWVQGGLTPCPEVKVIYEHVNKGAMSSPGIKGAWTGDYLEFNLPVDHLAAGTKIQVKFPMYGRQHPAFWYIRYLDGDDWKIHNQHTVTGIDGVHTCECTFPAAYGGTTIEETITLENAIENKYLKIRIEVADGRCQISGANTIVERECPNGGDNGEWSIAFYFFNAKEPQLPFSFTIVE